MIYMLTKVVSAIIFTLFYRFQASGRELVPDGAIVLVSNHQSYLDPVAVGLAMPRPVYFIAKEELFRIPIFGWYIRKLHAFPINRGIADRQVMKTALKHLRQGRPVLIFPEGTRHRDDGLADGFPGAAFIAYKAGVPLVPTAIRGTGDVLPPGARFPRFPRISVAFGEPITVDASIDKKQALNETMERLMSELKSLLGEVKA